MRTHTKIQKWGNGLALRVSGLMRDIPHFEEGTEVDIEINEKGFIVEKVFRQKNSLFPFSEEQLLQGLTPHLAHADLVITPLDSEMGSP
jgi:antitoxin MazE